ncbi:TetR/AcrR family transcriptional regulator [Kocuria nitroreducens]|uniref:TetR/AcrR family transcriptional regulator n=1 Tax=Kocuria nitroreducens TaxID=3058914 RepID=UPI0036DF6278
MATGRTESRAARAPSLIERTRRTQLIDVTLELVAEHGYAGTSLARIARAAGITKGAVLYHFPSKDAVIAAARDQVLAELVADVGAAVESSPVSAAPAVYVRRMVEHLTGHPYRARMIVESGLHEASLRPASAPGSGARPAPAERWQPLALLLQHARPTRGTGPASDLRTLAIAVGGAIDGLISEKLDDPSFDAVAAAETVVRMLEGELFC